MQDRDLRHEYPLPSPTVEMMQPDTTDHPPESKRLCEIVLNLVDHLDAMVAYWDINQTCVFANDAYRAWFGKSAGEVVGLTMQQLLGPLYAKNLPYIRAAYDGHRQVFEREIPTPGGDVRSSLATYTPHRVDGQVLGIFVHVADVTPLKKLERELNAAKDKAEYLATHDFLTGMPNRVLLMDRIAVHALQRQRGSVWITGGRPLQPEHQRGERESPDDDEQPRDNGRDADSASKASGS